MSNTAVGSAFDQGQFDEAYPPGIEDTYWHLARCRILEKQVRAGNGKRVLDVGCGRGIVVEYLLARGIDCYGVELSPVPVPAHLSGRLQTGVLAEELDETARLATDTIILGDVIEHLPDPVQFLTTLRDAFPNLKSLIVAVPARQELWSNYDEHYGHYRRYDRKMLEETLTASGFIVEESSYMFRLLYLPARLLLAIQKKRSVRLKGAGSLGLLHQLAARLIEADFHLLPASTYGLSVIGRSRRG